MHVAVFTAERRLAPAASSETASSSRRIPVSCIIVKESRAERPRGSQRGYPCRKTFILIITIRHLLSPRSFTRPPIGIPCGLLSASGGEGRAYYVPDQSQDRLGLASTPVAIRPRCRTKNTAFRPHTFWSQRVSLLRCFPYDGAWVAIQFP